MDKYAHLPLPEYIGNLDKKKKKTGGGGFQFPTGRNKRDYFTENINKANQIARSYQQIKQKFQGKIHPKLIYRIKINQSVDIPSFEKTLHALGGLTVLSVAENRQGYWVVFANDVELKIFKEKIAQYSGIKDGNKYDFFNAIDGIEDIPIDEKIGHSIKEEPLVEGQTYFLDVELWRMEDRELLNFIDELKKTFSTNNDFKVTDQLIMPSFALLRIKMNKSIFEEVIQLREIAKIERPIAPLFNPFEYKEIDIEDIETLAPDDDSVGILVVDSGIVSNHPLLEKAVGDEGNFQKGENGVSDLAGHGTAVAGNAIYGNIDEHISAKRFVPSNWLFSAKVMYAEKDFNNVTEAVYDPEKLIESQFNEAVRHFLDNPDYKIKVVNISFGNRYEIFGINNRQFPLANLIDELALEYRDVIFVISIGNQNPLNYFNFTELIEGYPDFLVNNNEFRLINPATSALSISVGSIATSPRVFDSRFGEEIWQPVAQEGEPSPFSRTGFGINGMVKPELVSYGGNLVIKENFGRVISNIGGKISLLSNNPIDHLFTFDFGSSFSAPKISNIIGKISNVYPDKSANFIKNLLLQSAETIRPPKFKDPTIKKEKAILQMTGYGLPDYEKALYSYDNRIVLFDEGQIGLNKIKVFSVNIPKLFFETNGYKRLSVVLTFDPVVRATRGDSYLGNRMEFKLFHSVATDEIAKTYGESIMDSGSVEDDTTPDALKPFEIVLNPGANTRKAGCHQKAWKEYKREPKALPQAPITLVLMNSNKWIKDEKYIQNYCLSLIVEHSDSIQLYNSIRSEIQQRVRIR